MKGLPSKFTIQNATVTFLLFLIFGALLASLSFLLFFPEQILIILTCVYIAGPVTYFLSRTFYRTRQEHHRKRKPASIMRALSEIRVAQDQINSRLDEIELKMEMLKT